MSQKLPANGFMWYDGYLSDFNEDFIKHSNEKSDKGYFLEVEILSTQINYGVLTIFT